MTGTKYGLAAVALMFTVGCGGARISALESELGACKENKATMSAENSKLQEDNAKLQAKVDEHAALVAARKATHDDLQAAILPMIDAGNAAIGIRNGQVTITLSADKLFTDRKAKISKDGKPILVQLATALKGTPHKYLIAGHTDSRSVKDKRARFRDNYEFGLERAYEVYALVSSGGVNAENLAVASFGHADPIGDNANEEGQAANRRIEVVVLPNVEAILPVVAQVQP